jgi:hypothetical protein
MLRNLLLGAVLAISFATAASAATMQFAAALDGKSEVPPNTSKGFGDALATLDTKTKTLTDTITFQGPRGPATAPHFHGPAAEGANAGVAVAIAKDPVSPGHREREVD